MNLKKLLQAIREGLGRKSKPAAPCDALVLARESFDKYVKETRTAIYRKGGV